MSNVALEVGRWNFEYSHEWGEKKFFATKPTHVLGPTHNSVLVHIPFIFFCLMMSSNTRLYVEH